MKIKKLQLGNFQTNAYIVSNDKNECIVIDPGSNGKKITKYLESEELDVHAILLTHGHFDHIGAVDYLYHRNQCPIYIHQEDVGMLKDTNLNLSYYEEPLVLESPVIAADESLEIIGFNIHWLHLPGHCPGSSMLHFVNEEVIFSGDVIFKDSIGRFDLPNSSHHDTKQSLQKIKELKVDAVMYPGHGESTTLAQEQQSNPYLQ